MKFGRLGYISSIAAGLRIADSMLLSLHVLKYGHLSVVYVELIGFKVIDMALGMGICRKPLLAFPGVPEILDTFQRLGLAWSGGWGLGDKAGCLCFLESTKIRPKWLLGAWGYTAQVAKTRFSFKVMSLCLAIACFGLFSPDLGGKNFERDFVDIDLHASWGSRLRCFYRSGFPYTWGKAEKSG